jgi:hypothetical protein
MGHAEPIECSANWDMFVGCVRAQESEKGNGVEWALFKKNPRATRMPNPDVR